jgi:hypothetical protein
LVISLSLLFMKNFNTLFMLELKFFQIKKFSQNQINLYFFKKFTENSTENFALKMHKNLLSKTTLQLLKIFHVNLI